jgi:ABC-2 type transport system ATP-binding protein
MIRHFAMIELNNLQKVQDQRTTIDIPAFKVPDGAIAALIGPAGNVQEALLELLIGRSQPSRGTLRIANIDPRLDKEAFSRLAGAMFVEDGLYKNQTVEENLLFHCRLRGIPINQAKVVLAEIGLADQAHRRAGLLQASLARRLAFGRAILHAPRVLLLVEPFQRCDEASIEVISSNIRTLAAAGGSVLILAGDNSHLTDLCDAIYLINQGRIAAVVADDTATLSGRPFKIPVKLEGRVALVNPGDILFAEAEGDTTFIQTAGERLPTQFTLAELEERLKRSGFFRAHRSYLVNLQHVKEVIPYTRNSFSLRLDDNGGTIIPLSKNAAGELRELLDY